MTRQELHTCDVCGEMFYVPNSRLRTLEINRNQDDEITYDLCADCHVSLLGWIQERRKGEGKEAEED